MSRSWGIGNCWRSCVAISSITPFAMPATAPPTGGLPLEVFLFVNRTSWESYEQIQSDMFDYVYGILPLFHLRVWQMR